MFNLATDFGYHAWEVMCISLLLGVLSFKPLTNLFARQTKREKLYAFWKNPKGKMNQPEQYHTRTDRSDYIAGKIAHYSYPQDHILELGCNVGRNLNALWSKGYQNLSAIEINEQCQELMKQYYPELRVNLYIDTIENKIFEMAPRSIDLTFTCAVLMHLHKTSNTVFPEIARITKKTIITLEDETGRALKNQPRNYKAIFENLGFLQVESHHFNDDLFKKGYVLRVFTRKSA